MKKFISILLVFCLSGCTVLDFVAEDTQKQPDNLRLQKIRQQKMASQ